MNTRSGRWVVFYIPYLVLAIGLGIGLQLVSDKASSNELSSERTARLRQDCHSRVEARDVLRDVVTEAYLPPPGTPPERAELYAARRDAILSRVPPLKCETAAGIPIPEPVSTVPPSTTDTSAEGEPVA